MNSCSTGAPTAACREVTDIVPNHEPYTASDNDSVPYIVSLDDFEDSNRTYMPKLEYQYKYSYYNDSCM